VKGKSSTGGIFVAAQKLTVAKALSQEGARKLASERNKLKDIPTDNRNLYLLKEGEVKEVSGLFSLNGGPVPNAP
jgi:hypothetical protein